MQFIPQYDQEKALEVLIYVAHQCSNEYNILKVIYYADKLHLSKYGRQITGDKYVAMEHGAVPSALYDLVKDVRENRTRPESRAAKEALQHENPYTLKPRRNHKPEYLSKSDIECLDQTIKNYGNWSFDRLKKKSHNEPDFKQADPNGDISSEALIKSVPDGNLLWEQLTNCYS